MTIKRTRAFERPCDVNGCRRNALYAVDVFGLGDPALVCAEHTGHEARSYWGCATDCSSCFVGQMHIRHELVTA